MNRLGGIQLILASSADDVLRLKFLTAVETKFHLQRSEVRLG
jgi:hypothetical protein